MRKTFRIIRSGTSFGFTVPPNTISKLRLELKDEVQGKVHGRIADGKLEAFESAFFTKPLVRFGSTFGIILPLATIIRPFGLDAGDIIDVEFTNVVESLK